MLIVFTFGLNTILNGEGVISKEKKYILRLRSDVKISKTLFGSWVGKINVKTNN